jgi:diacylglycerol kinase family enzyme
VLAPFGRLDDASAIWRGEPAEVTVETRSRSVLVSLDGEIVRLETPLRYRSRPGALVVIASAVAG